MFYLYIIYSSQIDKFYIGSSHNLEERILKHNNHVYENAYTKAANDWEYMLNLKCNNKAEAQFLERFIKKMKSKVFIKKVIQNPDILKDILRQRF